MLAFVVYRLMFSKLVFVIRVYNVGFILRVNGKKKKN